jgi:hypothetical protein
MSYKLTIELLALTDMILWAVVVPYQIAVYLF